jgi:iron complex outermembrane receptor protein
MKVSYKTLARTTVALASLCVGSQVFATEAPEDGGNEGGSNDIIVSARRIEERLQDVPISVAVVNQDQLTKANITSADDLSKIIPGLNVEQRYTAETNAFAIRGFNQALRTTAAVGTYFGEVVAPRGGAGAFPGGDGAGPGNLFDLQNVQVLKGPQGTLFGRNTTGGAVLLTPKKPTDQLEGYIQGSYGNFNMYQLQAVVNLPLASWARLRLGVDRMQREGTQNNYSGIGPARLNDIDYYALRGSLVLDITPDLENYTIVSYSDSDHIGTQPQIYRANPFTNFGGATKAGAQVARLLASNDPYRVENNMSNPRSHTKNFQVINTTKWNVSDTITLKNIVSYASFEQNLNQSVFGSNWPGSALIPIPFAAGIDSRISTAQAFNGEGQNGNDQRSFSEEFQIQGHSSDGRLQYQAGLYFEHSTPGNPTNNESISVGAVCLVGPYNGLAEMRCLSGTGASVNQSISTIEYINKAVYAQATYAVTERVKLTAGFRLTNDVTNATNRSYQWNFNSAPPLGATIPIPLSQFVAPTLGVGADACQIPNKPFASSDPATNCLVPSSAGLHTESTRPTWTLSAQYNPTPDVMLYGTYSRGYRQGSAGPGAIGAKTTFDPETVDSFEIGAKTSWRGTMPGHFNATGFYSKLKDYQMLVGLQCTLAVCPASSSATSVFNAGKAHMYGIEFDGSLRPSDFFRLDFAGAWVHTRVDAFTVDLSPYIANFNNRLSPAAVGDPMPLTPEFSANVSAIFKLPIPESAGKLEFTASYRYSSSFNYAASDTNSNAAAAIRAALPPASSPLCNAACQTGLQNAALIAATPIDKATAVKQIDLNLDWRDVGGMPVDIGVFATNVTDQVTYTLIQPLFNSFGFDLRYLGQPRMYGARLKVRFGRGTSS